MIPGFDTSHWQNITDMAAAHRSGRVFAIIKATEGIGWRDPTYPVVRKFLHDNGMVAGAYHFARPGSGADQADYFASVAGLVAGELPALDMEDEDIDDPVGFSVDFAREIIKRYAVPPPIYLNTWFVQNHNWKPVADLNCSLWFAKYDGNADPTAHAVTGAFPFVAFKQYTSTGTVPGISPAGEVDLDSFNGTIDQLRKYTIKGAAPAPKPPVPPKPVPVKHPVVFAWNLPPGDCYGSLTNPSKHVHGGYNAWERPFVEDIQCWLVYHGCARRSNGAFVPASAWETDGWSDGKWGPQTDAAMTLWHQRHYPHQPQMAQCWDDDYRILVRP